jgi:hypothetical protein
MKLFLTMLACLIAASAGAQTIKTLGYNTTNGQVVYSGTNVLRMPDQVKFGTNGAGVASGGQFFSLLDGGGGVSMLLGTNAITVNSKISFSGISALSNAAATRTNFGLGATWLTNTNVTNFRSAIGLGETNDVTFSNVNVNGTLTAANLSLSNTTVTNPFTFSNNVTIEGTFVFASPTVPTTTTNTGVKGQLAYTNNYLYICISNNTWRRIQLGTW